MPKSANAQYNVATADSLSVRLAGRARRLMFERFLSELKPSSADTILDVGVTSDRTYNASNYLEAWYPHKRRIVAAGIDNASHLERDYVGMRFVYADGRQLPFADGSFDFVHSSAVLEHVGNPVSQYSFIRELCRVSRKGAFLTTPNRWYPMEFHTILPLIHWLPKHLHRGMLKMLGYNFFAQEDNLNLLGKRDLLALCKRLPRDCHYQLGFINFLGGCTNLILVVRKLGKDHPPRF